MKHDLSEMTREQLIELLQITAKDLIAIDGTWFQSIEAEQGMDSAMEHDCAAWERFVPSEAKRLKAFLSLSDNCGLEGLAKALPLRCTSIANEWDMNWEDDGNTLVFRVTKCRVQAARLRKGMTFHPCKSAGQVEYKGFAKAIDKRINCECLSCYPEITDETCSCAWRFTIM